MRDKFITIAAFQYSSEAQIIKGRLEAEGVPVFLSDNYTIDTDPLVSNAIGGVKLKIYTEDREKAQEVLKNINKYALDDNGDPINCPNCSSTEVELFTNIKNFKALFLFLFSFLLNALPIYQKQDYYCLNCRREFNFTLRNLRRC